MENIVTLIIGAIAGWLGSQVFKGGSLGLIGNIVVGVLGSFVGSWILGKFGVSLGGGLIGSIITGVFGAVVILAIINLIFKSK